MASLVDGKKQLERAIAESGVVLGYSSMKEKQIEAISAFVEGNDTFVSLPTGYGKYNLCTVATGIWQGVYHPKLLAYATMHGS